jgi:VCBS repeat-containing protein
MASMLSRFRRHQPIIRKPRRRRLRLEQLEDRLSPAANLLVTTTIAGTEQVLREFTPDGELVRTALLPSVSGVHEPGRDLIYDASGKVHVYTGTFDPALNSYTLAGGGWTQRTHSGWSTVNNVSYGGIGVLGAYVYVTDMRTFSEPADEAKGVVRFNLVDGTSARFLETEEPQDLTIGKDGRLYLLSANTVKAYDPVTFALLSTVTLPAGDFRGIAVNAAGEIFAVNWSEQVYHLSASGSVLGNVTLTGVSDPMDIDVSGDGRIAVGTASGHVVQMYEDLTGITTFAAGSDRAFVAFGPDQGQSPAGPTPPTATLSSDVVQAEGNSGTAYAVFTVTLSAPSVDPIAFKYTTTNGTATSGTDYWFTAGTRILLPGQTSTQIFVPIVGDTTFEGDETFTLTLSDPVGVTLDDNRAQGTITNDDPSTPYVIVADVSRNEGGQYTGTLFSFLVQLSTPSPQTVTVSYATRDNTAVAGSDYTARSGTLTFNPGQLQQAVDVTVLGDLVVEPDETFFFELSNATNADITDAQAVGTIVNDDSLYQLSVGNASVNEGNSGTTWAVFPVTLNQASPGTITVDFYTSGGDATAGVDYYQTTGTLLLSPGETATTISVPILGDTEAEPDEVFFVVLANPTGAALATEYGMGTIATDDGAPTPPVAQPDAYDLGEDEVFTVYGFGVLANDYSSNGDLTASLVSGPAHGTLTLSPSGSFTYTPAPNYTGPDSFTYRATDSLGLSADATVSLTVWPMNDPTLLTVPGPQTTAEETPLTFSAATGNAITVFDTDQPRVLVALLVHDGILTLPSTAGLEFPDPDSVNNSPHITFYADNPAEANAALNGLVFTPNLNYNGSVYLDLLVRDETFLSYPMEVYGYVPLTVTPVNDAPVAVADSYEWYEDMPLTVYGLGVLGNDSDPEWDPLSAVLVSGPAHGTLTLSPGGSFTYTPEANYFGPDSFVYRATDPAGLSAEATVSLTVWAMDDPIQLAVPASQTTAEDTPLTFAAATGNAITITDLESPPVLVALLVQNGILTLPSTDGLEFPDPGSVNNSPSITFYADDPAEANAALDGLVFTPDPDFHGWVYLSLLVRDTTVVSYPMEAYGSVSITVTPVNDAPVAVDDSYVVEAGEPFVTTLGGGGDGVGVLMNDQDADGDLLSAVLVSGPAHGTLALNPDGTFTYTAEASYNGTDTFTYRAFDGELESGLATVTLTVTQVNDAPVAGNDSYSVDEDGALTTAAPGVLGNDGDADGDTLSAWLVSGPSHGVLSFNADGSFTYTPNPDYCGTDSFTYKASDGQLDSTVATVAITVNPINDAPVAVDDAYSVNEDQTLTIAPTPGVTSVTMVSQPGDYIGQGLTYSFTPETGTFLVSRNFDNGVSLYYSGGGQWWYFDFAAPFNADLTPGDYANATRWPFQASDVPGLNVSGNGRGSNTLTGHFTVTQAVYAADGTVLRFAATFEQHSEGLPPALTGEIKFNQGDGSGGILLNDSDAETDPLTIIVVSNPAHGTLSMNVDGSFTYTPDANYHGPDSFTYKLSDGTSESNVATVSLTVNPVNDFPTANPDTYVVAEDTVLTVAAPGVLANDSDVDGDSLTALLVTAPTHGSLAFHADGSFTYTPSANYNGSDSFQYAAYDGSALSFIRTVTLLVTSVNDAPTAADDSYTTAEDTPLSVAAAGVLGNDADVEGTALTALLVSGPAHGALTLNSDGSFTYTPDADYHGPDSFTYRARDGAAGSNVATVSLTVLAVDDAPAASDDAYAVAEDQTLVVAAAGVLGNDGDADGDVVNAVLVSGPAHGTLTLNADGSFTYTPHANYHGADSFTYKASAGGLHSNVATVALTVNAVNDAPVAAAGPDRANVEGGTATFDASGSSDVDGDNLTYFWDFGDGNSAYGATVQYAHADQGTYTVTLTVSDGTASATDTMVRTVSNGAPVALLSGPTSGVRGQARTFLFAAADPSPVDAAAGFTFSINWGDGTTQTVSGPSGQQVDHVFVSSGTYLVSVYATDKDGGVSSIAQQQISITVVEMQGGNLVVGGTAGNDSINLKVANTSGGVKVTINGSVQGTFTPSGQILVYAQAGTDTVKFETAKFSGVTRYLQTPAVVYGDAGNDTLDARGSSANNVLVGGAGNDIIYGGLGRDILLGGLGADTLRGGQGEDLLVGTATAHDNHLPAVLALMAEWGRTDLDYATRAQHLHDTPGGLNGDVYLNPLTVADDAAIDQLYGEGNLDLFFTTSSGPSADRVNDAAGGEWIIPLS